MASTVHGKGLAGRTQSSLQQKIQALPTTTSTYKGRAAAAPPPPVQGHGLHRSQQERQEKLAGFPTIDPMHIGEEVVVEREAAAAEYIWVDTHGQTEVWDLKQVSTFVGNYPAPHETHQLVANIQYDSPWGLNWTLEQWTIGFNSSRWLPLRYNFRTEEGNEWIHSFSTEHLFESFRQTLIPNALYRFLVNETGGDGIVPGWISITNGTPTGDNPKGTVVWNVMGDAFANSTEVYLWVDALGHTVVVDLQQGLYRVETSRAARGASIFFTVTLLAMTPGLLVLGCL